MTCLSVYFRSFCSFGCDQCEHHYYWPFPAISLQLLQFFRFCMTLIIMVSMLESYFEAIQYFKKIINYQLEETSCFACTWDGLVLEVWNIVWINRCDLSHQFPYIKPPGQNRFHHFILYQPLRSDARQNLSTFSNVCVLYSSTQIKYSVHSDHWQRKNKKTGKITHVCLICIYFFGLIR